MMKGLALALAVLQAQPASLPICDALDAKCLKLHLLDEILKNQDLAQKLASTSQQLDLSKAATQAALDAATSANNYAQKIEAETKTHWYDSPVFLFAMGFLAASAAAIGLAAAFAHVTR